ncbi:MAG: hypothetical protein MI866_17210 [Bacteroidales bacterium]|nr:hypothetical protein [Bacteroidales bacterium]
MRKIIYILAISVLLACTPDDYVIQEVEYDSQKVKYVETKVNTDVYYANGINELSASFMYYDVFHYTVNDYEVNEDGDTLLVTIEKTDTLRLKNDRVPDDAISFIDGNGQGLALPMVLDSDTDELEIYAEISSVTAEKGISIDIRPSEAQYEKVMIPVVFHLINSASYELFNYQDDDFDKVINNLNKVFNDPVYRAGNSGNPNIEFVSAKYDPDGAALEIPGLHEISTLLDGKDLYKDILNITANWSIKHYLNIYVCNAPSKDDYSPKDVFSTVDEEDLIKGLDFTAYESTDAYEQAMRAANKPEELGLLIGAQFVENTVSYNYDFLSTNWPQLIGEYLGLLPTAFENFSELVDGDIDYCDDTYSYSIISYGNATNKEKRSSVGTYFDSENIMDIISTNKVTSVEQVKRMRWVLENSPSRQAWKSSYALTGQE